MYRKSVSIAIQARDEYWASLSNEESEKRHKPIVAASIGSYGLYILFAWFFILSLFSLFSSFILLFVLFLFTLSFFLYILSLSLFFFCRTHTEMKRSIFGKWSGIHRGLSNWKARID
jgi:uncharacterized membrane protein